VQHIKFDTLGEVTGDGPPGDTPPGDNPLPKIPPEVTPPDHRLLVSLRVRNMGWCQFSDNSMPCGSVRVGLEPHILGRLGSGPRVGVGVTSRGYFGRRLVSRGELSPGSYLLESLAETVGLELVIFTARFPLFICYIDLLSVVFIGLTAFYLIVAVIVLSCCIILRAHVLKYV